MFELFDYLTKELGYSPQTASERVNAVRLMRAIPEVKEHLEKGKLTLTSAAQIQRSFQAEQKVHPKGKAVSLEEKIKTVESCLGQSSREVKTTLFENQSEPARIVMNEKIKSLTPTRSEIKFTVEDATIQKLQALKELIGDQSLENIFDRALDVLLKSEQKKRGVIESQKCAKMPKSDGDHHASYRMDSTPSNDADFSPALVWNRTDAQLNSRFIAIELR